MANLWFSRVDLSPSLAKLFELVLQKLPTKSILDLDASASDSKDKDKSGKTASDAAVFFMGDASRLLRRLREAAAPSTVNIIRELTWNLSAELEKPEASFVQWSVEELPFCILREGVFLVPRAVKPFYANVMKTVPKWEEALRNKCLKAVFCSVQNADRGDGSKGDRADGKDSSSSNARDRWNVMRSNESLKLPPYVIPAQFQDELLTPSTSKYQPFFDSDNWRAANHLWAERMHVDYVGMGFHSDRRMDLCGDIRLYTDYSDRASAAGQARELRAKDLAAVLADDAGDALKRFRRQPGMKWLEVRRKSSKTKAGAEPTRKGNDRGDRKGGKDSQEETLAIVPMPAGSLLVLTAAANTCLQHAIRGEPAALSSQRDIDSMVLTYRGSNTWLERVADSEGGREQTRVAGAQRAMECVRDDKAKWGRWLEICGKDNRELETPFGKEGARDTAHWCVSPADLLPPVPCDRVGK